MKIKVIDLLNKIANKEKLPKRIKYNDVIYRLNKSNEYISDNCLIIFMMKIYEVNLNDEVELLEDEKIDIQSIKELDIINSMKSVDVFASRTENLARIDQNEVNFFYKIVDLVRQQNQILKYLKQQDK